jgi:hypothetical protein
MRFDCIKIVRCIEFNLYTTWPTIEHSRNRYLITTETGWPFKADNFPFDLDVYG